MLKKIYLPVLFVIIFLAGCQTADTDLILEKVNQAGASLTALRQSNSINQTIQNNAAQNPKNSQLSMAVIDESKGFEGKIVKKQDGESSQFTSVISNPVTTVYKENGSDWQYSLTPDLQTNKINIITYHQTQEIVNIIAADAEWLQLPFYYIISFNGQNSQLNGVINRLVQEDHSDETLHNLQIVINKNNYYIDKVSWQAKGIGHKQNQPLLSEIELNFASHNTLNVTKDFAQISEYDLPDNEVYLNSKEIN